MHDYAARAAFPVRHLFLQLIRIFKADVIDTRRVHFLSLANIDAASYPDLASPDYIAVGSPVLFPAFPLIKKA